MQHTLAWLCWVLAAAVAALTVRNPFYLLIIALSAWLVYLTAAQSGRMVQSWGALLKVGALVWLLAIPLNALMLHQGRHVLFRLPAHWPLVGGAITLEAVIHGTVTGVAIWVLLLIFAAFNLCVDASRLLRLSPAFVQEAGVVASIAVTFIPQMVLSAREIREAQRIRGHRFRGWRDLLPLIMPLLTTALERAIQLAESMESRGYGHARRSQAPLRVRALMLAALAALLAGLVLGSYWPQHPWVGQGLLALGALALVALFVLLSRGSQRTHYSRLRWRWPDVALAVAGLVVLGGVVAVTLVDRAALVYYPFPPYPLLPDFDPSIGLMLSLLALPGIYRLLSEAPAHDALQGRAT